MRPLTFYITDLLFFFSSHICFVQEPIRAQSVGQAIYSHMGRTVKNQTSHVRHVGVPKGCNKEFLWESLLPDACSINSPSESQLCSVGLWSGLSYRRPVRGDSVAEGYSDRKSSHSRSSDRLPSSSSRSSSSSGL